jgi:hypothetical protein
MFFGGFFPFYNMGALLSNQFKSQQNKDIESDCRDLSVGANKLTYVYASLSIAASTFADTILFCHLDYSLRGSTDWFVNLYLRGV